MPYPIIYFLETNEIVEQFHPLLKMRSLQLQIWYTAQSGSKTCLLSDSISCLGFKAAEGNTDRDLVGGGWSGLLFHNSEFTLLITLQMHQYRSLRAWQFLHLFFSPVQRARCPHQVTYQVSILLLLTSSSSISWLFSLSVGYWSAWSEEVSGSSS